MNKDYTKRNLDFYRHDFYNGLKLITWSYEELKTPILGVGPEHKPFICADDYIDHSINEELNSEICLALSSENLVTKTAMVLGGVPQFERKKLNGADNWTEMLRNIKKYDKTGIHQKNIKNILDNSNNNINLVYRYCYFSMGAPMPWYDAIYLIHGNYEEKSNIEGRPTENIKYFPKIMKYVKTLPFKYIGRLMIFTTFPGAGVIAHRDFWVKPHKDHQINFFFTKGRPSYVYDCIKEEKSYLNKDVKSYIFNNQDYHGVDPEPEFRYTLRVDGEFEDWFQKELGLIDGYIWNI